MGLKHESAFRIGAERTIEKLWDCWLGRRRAEDRRGARGGVRR